MFTSELQKIYLKDFKIDLTLSLPRAICPNIGLPLNSNISKMVRLNIAFTKGLLNIIQ